MNEKKSRDLSGGDDKGTLYQPYPGTFENNIMSMSKSPPGKIECNEQIDETVWLCHENRVELNVPHTESQSV